MSDRLENSRVQEMENEIESPFLGHKIKNRVLFEANRNNNDNKEYEVINLKESPKKKNKDDDDNLDNESDEYYEEEDEEEDGEIDDDEDEDDEINSEFKKCKKRKLDNVVGVWSRKKSDIKDIENDESQLSADIVINKPENKTDKNFNEEKTIMTFNNEYKTNNNKKANFFITPVEIPLQAKNLPNLGEQKTISNYFNVNNINNKTQQNSFHSDSIRLNNQNNNINNTNPNSIYDNRVKNITYHSFQTSEQSHIFKEIYDQLSKFFNLDRLNIYIKNFTRELKFKYFPDEKSLLFLQEKLKQYLKIYLLRLIKISRIRNANFNLYSNNPNGQTHYKFRTYNWAISQENQKINVTFSPAKVFDILFTSNFKKRFDLMEEYMELYNKKTKFEKLSSCKEKYEESSKNKGIESSIKITDGPNPTIKLLPGRRTKKKNNTFIKEMRKKIVQTKKKEDLNMQKSFTKNTLDAFLNDSISANKNQSFASLHNLIEGSSTNMLDMSSKMSDTMSHNNLSYTNYYNNSAQNEISMNVFTYFEPTKDGKIIDRQKKRINLKDFIFLLENSNEYIPNKVLLLNKASIDNVKNK